MSTGMRVEPGWADEREGSNTDMAHWMLSSRRGA